MQFIDERNEKLIKEIGNLRWSDAVSIEIIRWPVPGIVGRMQGILGVRSGRIFQRTVSGAGTIPFIGSAQIL